MKKLIENVMMCAVHCLCFALPVCAQTAKSTTHIQQRDTVYLKLYVDSVNLDEVVVKAKKTPAANSSWNNLTPIELVTQGGANGDLYRALETLPGVLLQGESGKLLVRGGSSSEVQTYIDGMHVLNPYTTTSVNTPVRSRYSTFMFSGINLYTGGASLEYGDALSAVLPLETKDRSVINKLGLNLSSVGIGGGGTRTFTKGSLSMNVDYQNLSMYDHIYSGRLDFKKPYRMLSGATQLRYHPGDSSLFKLYVEYDHTAFSNYSGNDSRLFALDEDNLYLNATYRKTTSKGWNYFAGIAYSHYQENVHGAVLTDDSLMERQQEVHLKTKIFKRINPKFRMEVGSEGLFRQYDTHYKSVYSASIGEEEPLNKQQQITPVLWGSFISGIYYPVEKLKAELSFRAEYVRPNEKMTLSPRLALNYFANRMVFSTTIGRYTQMPDNKYMLRSGYLDSQVCNQYNMGGQYNADGRFYKAEIYYKDYRHLPLMVNEASGSEVTSQGYGYSKGLDLFFNDRSLMKNFEYQFSYTYNISKRKYAEYTELTVPQYATRHNAALILKYSIPTISTIIGLTNQFTSGRPYHNPNLQGLMNDEVKPYNSLDLGLTFLPSRKVIIHASASNILCRKNEFGKVDNKAVLASSDHFFYIGVFISLGKKAAYDVSNF